MDRLHKVSSKERYYFSPSQDISKFSSQYQLSEGPYLAKVMITTIRERSSEERSHDSKYTAKFLLLTEIDHFVRLDNFAALIFS